MNKFQKSVASAFAAGALLLNGLMPVLGATHLVISGNGSDSNNDVNVEVEHSTSVVQSNNADVTNEVNAKSNTGDNKAKGNTGGEVSVETGDATNNVSVTNTLNSNAANVDCCSNAGDVTLEIKDNGSDSDNDIDYDSDSGSKESSNVYVRQSNYSDVTNKVYTDAKTGDNDVDDNTGGNVSVETGDASATVTLSTTANANSAKVGGQGEGASLSAVISGNGSDSENDIDLDLENAVWFLQGNNADVYNKVDGEAETGDNEAEDNTGGEVSIETGDADVMVAVDNMVNFNWADGDCGCLLEDVLAKIANNGEDTDNKIEAELGSQLGVEQGNCDATGLELYEGDCELDNKVKADADSGDNEVEDSTQAGEDPAVETGDASTTVELDNSGNSNVYGATPEFEFPDVNVHFSFDLNDLLGWLMGSH